MQNRRQSVRAFLQQTSLADTDVPDTISLDSRGHLIVDSGSKAVLDYFLSLTGEVNDIQIRWHLARWAASTIGEPAASELLSLFDQYQRYTRELASGRYAASGDEDIRTRLRHRQQLRDAMFPEGRAEALFAQQDRHDAFSLDRRDIIQSGLSDAEQARALTTLRQQLPAHLASQHEQQHQLHRLASADDAIRAAGGTSADIFTHRQQTFGAAAAERLQALDAQRQAWENRLASYRHQRDQVLDAALAPADQQEQVQRLREKLFTEVERRRVAALDRVLAGSR
ncbi:MAG: lipase secretion chaperone [Alcanivoracaceae bacterium]